MTQLALQPRARDGESVASFCSRTAALHGAENASNFWSLFGLKFDELSVGTPSVLVALQRLLGPRVHVNPRGLSQVGSDLTVRGHRLASRFVSLGQDRVCAMCLADDEENGLGRHGNRAFARLHWLPKFLNTCPVHQVELVELPRISWRLGPDFALRLRQEPGGIEGLCSRTSSMRETNFERYARERFEWHLPTEPCWLDDYPLQVAVHLCEMVGAETQAPERDWSTASVRELTSAAEAGFDQLRGGIGELERVLAAQAARNFRSRRRHCPTTIFGHLVAEALQFAQYPGYAEILSVMRDVGVKHLALGPEDEFLGAVTKRQHHSVYSASREYGVPASSIRKVLEELGKLEPARTVAKSTVASEQEVFEVRFMEYVVEIVRDRRITDIHENEYVTSLKAHCSRRLTSSSGHVSVSEAANKLRVREGTVSALSHEGFLREVFPDPSAAIAQYAKFELRRFYNRFLPERELAGFAKKLGVRASRETLRRGLKPQIPKWRAGENFYLRDDVKMLLATEK